MKLTHLLTETIIVSRMQAVSGTSNRTALSTVTAEIAHLQPLSAQKAQLTGGVYGKAYRIWTDPDVDIEQGDDLRDEEGNHYRVKRGGVTRHNNQGIDYKEYLIELVT